MAAEDQEETGNKKNDIDISLNSIISNILYGIGTGVAAGIAKIYLEEMLVMLLEVLFLRE